MARYVHLVFSDPPAGVPDDEFNAWYDEHVQEILSVDGWVTATRYRIEGVVAAETTGGYRYLSCYELDCPPEQAVANLEASGMGDAAAYAAGKPEGDALPVPTWFDAIRFASWNCVQVGEPHQPTRHAPPAQEQP